MMDYRRLPLPSPHEDEGGESVLGRAGCHYNIIRLKRAEVMNTLRGIFQTGKADGMNFVLFSTSGVHGSGTTIEEIWVSLTKYPDGFDDDCDFEKIPADYRTPHLTVLIVHPRLVCLKYGELEVKLEDIPFLKQIRASSWEAVQKIGADDD